MSVSRTNSHSATKSEAGSFSHRGPFISLQYVTDLFSQALLVSHIKLIIHNLVSRCVGLSYLQRLWKSSPSSTPRAGHTPQGVARHPEAAGSLGGSAGARGPSPRHSRLARTACRTGAAASPIPPWVLFRWIVFLQTGENDRSLMLGFWNKTL